MNKLTVAIALVSALVGLVAISSVGANLHKKLHHKHEGGELHKPHHGHHGHHGHKGHKAHPHHHHKHEGGEGPKPHHGHEGGEVPKPHHGHEGGEGHKPHHGPHLGPGPKCFCPKSNCQNQRHPTGLGGEGHQPEQEEGGRGSFEGGRGSFEGAGLGFGFKKEKEFDANVRGEDRERDRNQFQKHQGFSAGESDRFNGGESSSDLNTVEGVHKRKNINNNKVVVAETNRGNEDVDGFRLQNGHSQENHFAGGDNKFVNVDGEESASQEHDSDKDFEAGVHKKEEAEGFGGAGVVRGQF